MSEKIERASGGSPPLKGRRILVTRRPEQAEGLSALLVALGARVIEVPAIAVEAPLDSGLVDEALRRLASYEWLLFTSANAVVYTAERLRALGAAFPRAVRVATLGPATTDAFRAAFPGRAPDVQPGSDFRGEGLVEAFAKLKVEGKRFLLPTSDRARDLLPAALRAKGASVDVVTAYRTMAPLDLRERITAALQEQVDVATFASPSAVENAVAAARDLLAGVPVAVIGPVTERAARAAGLEVLVRAEPSTAAGLVEGLVRHLQGVRTRRGAGERA